MNLNFYFLYSSTSIEGCHKIYAIRAQFLVNAPLFEGYDKHRYCYKPGYILGWPIAYSQKIKIVKVRLAPVQSMPIIEITFCVKCF